MKDRVVSAEKRKVTLHLSAETAKYIHDAAYDRGQTQSKFVEDLVVSHGRVESLDLDRLREIVADLGITTGGNVEPVVDEILEIFSIEKAGE